MKPKDTVNSDDIQDRANRAATWIASPEGQNAIVASRELAERAVEEFRQMLVIDASSLTRPFII